jgi:hypothetical protein
VNVGSGLESFHFAVDGIARVWYGARNFNAVRIVLLAGIPRDGQRDEYSDCG